ncbi:MAG: thymidylate synthase [Nanobdellota archaeon]
MITIISNNLSEAWEKTLIKLYENGKENKDMLRDDTAVIEINNPTGERLNDRFPMKKEIMEEYNDFITRGGDKGNVLEEHALYHERIFEHFNDQAEYVIERLREDPLSKRAQVSFWDPVKDQEKDKVPCIQIIWFRIIDKRLEMHVHMRANDAYKKLLMNLNIATELMIYIAKRLNVSIGKYIHIADSLHIYRNDKEDIERLYSCIK